MFTQTVEVNWGPRSDVRWRGTPNRATQCSMKAWQQSSAVVELNGVASGHLVFLSMIVRIDE